MPSGLVRIDRRWQSLDAARQHVEADCMTAVVFVRPIDRVRTMGVLQHRAELFHGYRRGAVVANTGAQSQRLAHALAAAQRRGQRNCCFRAGQRPIDRRSIRAGVERRTRDTTLAVERREQRFRREAGECARGLD